MNTDLLLAFLALYILLVPLLAACLALFNRSLYSSFRAALSDWALPAVLSVPALLLSLGAILVPLHFLA